MPRSPESAPSCRVPPPVPSSLIDNVSDVSALVNAMVITVASGAWRRALVSDSCTIR